MKSWKKPTDEMVEKALSSVKKEADRQYFFSRLKNPLWVEPLCERGYFKSPPGVKKLPDGFVQFTPWPELTYLVTIAEEAIDQVLDIILALPRTDNPRVYDDILSIALNLKDQNSAKLLPKLIEYTELEYQFFAYRYLELLQYWTTQGNIKEAIEITKRIIPFREDPKTKEKQQLRKKDSNALSTSLKPSPRFDQWEYQQILEKGVRPLAENEPYDVACILIGAVANMIQLGMHQEDLNKGRDEDFSEIWCRRLDKQDNDHQDAKKNLVHTLTYACTQVYDKAPEYINALDKELRDQRWKVFKRLRQLLYASYPNDQTLPWVRELLLGHEDYSKREYHYEFQLMIRKASEQFGPKLLSENEKTNIFDAIFRGPSKEDFQEWIGERYSEEAFHKRQRYFHHMQLRPFATLLSGEVKSYYEELEGESETEIIKDDDYAPYNEMGGGFVTYRSPKSFEDLESFTDEELLNYLNEWNREHRDKDNWLVEINISALADVFQSLFKDRIIPDSRRLEFWMMNRDKIARPIYVASMVKVMQELVRNKDFGNLARWIEFCDWVLLHPDSKRTENQDESRDHPNWGSSRRAVVDFIDACINKNANAPISARKGLVSLLEKVSNQFDWRLDNDLPVMLGLNDPVTEAINNTRSRALESLIRCGFWIRRHMPDDPVTEVTDILSKRLTGDTEVPLTRPEQAILALHFRDLYNLNRGWAIEQKGYIFPQGDISVWKDAFVSFILYNRPIKPTFDILREDFEYALENLNILTQTKDNSGEILDRLGQHLFIYYLWQAYPLTGEESLLELFYDKTKDDRKPWGQLFNSVAHLLSNSGKHLDKDLTDRAIAFFDWRFEAAESTELQNFTFWLNAECLEPEWRLRSFKNILDLGFGKDTDFFHEVRFLNKLLPDHISLVVKCFAKITDIINQSTQISISTDKTKPIITAGLNSENSSVRENAERARENLLRLGRFEYLDMR